jgi:hypothetical protein
MTAHRKAQPGVSLFAVLAIAGLGSLMAWLFMGPEAALRRGFEAALADQRSTTTGDVTVAESAPLDREHLWLSRSDDQPLGMTGPVDVGTRIDISGRDGRVQRLEVLDVRKIEIASASPGPPAQLVMVSCRVVGSPNKGVIRFLMDAASIETATHRVPAQKAL